MNAETKEASCDFERGMEEGCVGIAVAPEGGPQEPRNPRRPLGPSGAQHESGMANPAEPAASDRTEPQGIADDLAGVRPASRPDRVPEALDDAPGSVDGVGRFEGDAGDTVRPEAESGLDVRRLRFADAVRLLNSTPAGRVVNDRQVRRHRTRAEDAFCRDGRLDLVAYAAWLIQRFARDKNPAQSNVSTTNILTLIERQGFRCALTGRPLTPGTASLDHIVPLTQDGAHVIENTQVLHRDVNRAKGVLTNDQFIEICREVVAWVDAEPRRTTTEGDQA